MRRRFSLSGIYSGIIRRSEGHITSPCTRPPVFCDETERLSGKTSFALVNYRLSSLILHLYSRKTRDYRCYARGHCVCIYNVHVYRSLIIIKINRPHAYNTRLLKGDQRRKGDQVYSEYIEKNPTACVCLAGAAR